ncbi:hypothetical protein ACPDHD_11830 [Myroides odoratimimus]|uniref:hypothetical protein n=1 Tax=Myroides odoratimimus TaxID=76832 RepID=UPI003D2F2C09
MIEVPLEINDSEVLIRYVLAKHIKSDKIIEAEIFLDTRGGISLQRLSYCCTICAKGKAKLIEHSFNPTNAKMLFLGFVAFKLKDFKTVVENFKSIKPSFDCELIYSPMDNNATYIDISKETSDSIKLNKSFNYAHADLNIINPGNIEPDKPNSALKAFSRALFKKCQFSIEEHNNDIEFKGNKALSF